MTIASVVLKTVKFHGYLDPSWIRPTARILQLRRCEHGRGEPCSDLPGEKSRSEPGGPDYERFSRSITRIRAVGGGVSVNLAQNPEGSYEVTVRDGRVASFGQWRGKIWSSENEYHTGCLLDEAE